MRPKKARTARRPVEHVQEDVLAAEIEGQVEDPAPIDVADDPAVDPFQVLGQALQPEERGAGEGRIDVKLEVLPPGWNDLGRGVVPVFDPTADHLRQEIAGGVMNGAESGKIAVPVLAEPQVAELLIKDPFHGPLLGNAPARVIEEALVEIDPRVPVPP